MRGTTKRVWMADNVVARYQGARAEFPVIEMTVTSGPEVGRKIIATLDVDELAAQLQAMKDAKANSEWTGWLAPEGAPVSGDPIVAGIVDKLYGDSP
jgi:hypothetical protein